MKMLTRTYLVLAMLAGTVGAVQCYRWSILLAPNAINLLNFLPAFAFLGAYVAGRKTSRKAVHAVAIVLCLLTVGFLGFVTVAAEWLIDATAEVTDVREYQTILTQHWDSWTDLARHFPRPIPSDAKDVRFSYVPAFLQGGAHVQLRYHAAPATISELYTRFSGKTTKSFTGGDTTVHMNMKDGMPTTFFYTSGSANREFPDDYEVMAFDDVLKEKERPPGFYWNHGHSHGVAISKKRNEIIYWAESW